LSAQWIQAFPDVKRVNMRGYSALAAGDLVDIVRKVVAADVKLSVTLHN
jgi:hypothetical protein